MSDQSADYERVIAGQLSRHVLHDHRTGTRHDDSVASAVVVALDKAGFVIVRRQIDGDPECSADGCELAEGHPRPHQAPPAWAASPTTSQVASHGGDPPQRGIGGQGRAGTSPAEDGGDRG